MAHKTFISYKYSEARDLRDKIIKKLGEDASYYQGETSESPNLDDNATSTIKKKLSDMIYGTSVTILILSPQMKKSKWIDWEISYSLRNETRDGRTSKPNGIIGVIKKDEYGYDWFMNKEYDSYHGSNVVTYNFDKTYDIVKNNHFNSKPPIWHCDECKVYDALEGSYISFVKEDTFLNNPHYYIENAYNKMQKIENYQITSSL